MSMDLRQMPKAFACAGTMFGWEGDWRGGGLPSPINFEVQMLFPTIYGPVYTRSIFRIDSGTKPVVVQSIYTGTRTTALFWNLIQNKVSGLKPPPRGGFEPENKLIWYSFELHMRTNSVKCLITYPVTVMYVQFKPTSCARHT